MKSFASDRNKRRAVKRRDERRAAKQAWRDARTPTFEQTMEKIALRIRQYAKEYYAQHCSQ